MIPFNGGKFSLKLVFAIKLIDSSRVGDQGSEIFGDWRDWGLGRAGNFWEQDLLGAGRSGSRGIRDWDSGIGNQGTRTGDQGSGIGDLGFGIGDWGSGIRY